MEDIAEHLTRRFYDWEVRGRGWYVFNEAASPEPPFSRFPGHTIHESQAPLDDGREHTLLSSLAHRVASLFRGLAVPPAPSESPAEESIRLDERTELVHLSIVLPESVTYAKDVAEQFVLNLSQCRHPICLEFIGRRRMVTIHLAVDPSDEPTAIRLLQGHFPDAVVTRATDPLVEGWDDQAHTTVAEWGLSDEFMLPLRSYRSFNPDPLLGVISCLGSLGLHEVASLQILFEPVRHPWTQSIVRAVSTPDGGSFFSDAPSFRRDTLEKLSSPLYGVVVRGIGQSRIPGRDRDIIRNLTGSLAVLEKSEGNRLIALDNDLYDFEIHVEDALARRSRRSGMLLSLDELLSLVHLPGASVAIPSLVRSALKTKQAPESVGEGQLILGENVHAGKAVTVRQTAEQRRRHTYVIGASGSGKSTLLASMIKQDIEAGRGVGVLEPHGDLIDQVLTYVPPERYADVVLLDLSDDEYPVPFNILSAHSELEKNLLASDLTAVFQRLATSWGDQMTAVLSNGILAFLESSRGGTLADLRRFLVERPFREAYLPTVHDPEVVYYWRQEFPLLSGKPQGSVVTRLNTFLRPKPIRYMVAHGENRINVTDIMDSGKIFLARIPQGAIGEENAYLLGTLLVSAFHRSALCRQRMDAADRRPFFLYIDEFHHFVTPSMASILSGARKYGLGLVLAHQEYRQLESRNPDVASAVLSNAATRICFRVGDQDARRLESGLTGFDARDLQNLSVGNAICRIERAGCDFNLRVTLPPEVDRAIAERNSAAVRKLSRDRYAVSRQEVEAKLAEGRVAPSELKASKPERAPLVPVVPPVPQVVPATDQPVSRTLQPRPEPMPGRGGPRHKAIQHLIKHWAEGMGYRAQIEATIHEGRGAVDVLLRKGDMSIACEISITTPTDYECANVTKCLTAGFTHIVMICDDEDRLKKISDRVQSTLEPGTGDQVKYMTPQQLFRFIEACDETVADGGMIRGYRVTINRAALDGTQRSGRARSIKRTIADAALRRRKRVSSNGPETGNP